MRITATDLLASKLDLSALERLQEQDPMEHEPFRATIGPGESIVVDDKYYTLTNIQNALSDGYIEISEFESETPFAQEIETAESTTNNYSLTKVQIVNRFEYPQDSFAKFNANMDAIDSAINVANSSGTSTFVGLTDTPASYAGEGLKNVRVNAAENALEFSNAAGAATWGGISGTLSDQTDLQSELNAKANVSGQVFSGNISALNLSGTNTGDQDLSPYATTANLNAHTSDATIHFTEASIDHTNIQNIGTNTHAQIDTDLSRLANTSGTNTGDQDLSPYLTNAAAASTYATLANTSGVNTGDQNLQQVLSNGNSASTAIALQADNTKMFFGAGDDASIYYNGTDLVIDPREVGSGNLKVSNAYTLPDADGTANQVLATNGAGVLSFTNVADGSPLTTKGDVYTYDTDDSRLAVGSNDAVLKAASGETTGLIWEGSAKVQTGAPETIIGNIWLDTDDTSSVPSNADTVDNIHASNTATANTLLPLDASANLDLNQNELKEVSVINTTSQDTDLLIKVNNAGATTTAVQVHGDSGLVTMPKQSYVYARMSGTQVIPNSTVTTVDFDVADVDVLGEYSTSTNTFTAKEAGVYNVSGYILYENTNSNIPYDVRIYTTGDSHSNFPVFEFRVGANSTALGEPFFANVKITAGGTIWITTRQISGGNETLRGNGYYCILTITKVS